MSTTGTAVFFDGQTSRRQDVHVSLEHELTILRPDGSRIDGWPYESLRELSAPETLLRLTREGGRPLARLEIRDAALAEQIRLWSPNLHDSRKAEVGTARKVVFWSVFAVISFIVFSFFGIPRIASAVTPMLPWSIDRRMGETADAQLRHLLPVEEGAFECGADSDERPGREALDRLAVRGDVDVVARCGDHDALRGGAGDLRERARELLQALLRLGARDRERVVEALVQAERAASDREQDEQPRHQDAPGVAERPSAEGIEQCGHTRLRTASGGFDTDLYRIRMCIVIAGSDQPAVRRVGEGAP